jgi:hypothetical protein
MIGKELIKCPCCDYLVQDTRKEICDHGHWFTCPECKRPFCVIPVGE